VIPLFIQSVLQNKSPFIDGDGEQTRDFTFVENAVQANLKALFCKDEAMNAVYNVAVGERISVIELFKMIAGLGGTRIEPVHRERRAGDIRDSLADISTSQKMLGYEPTVYVKEGLKTTFDWFRQNMQS
jgi:UDP-N-acetylglucosamine 4-epimerase